MVAHTFKTSRIKAYKCLETNYISIANANFDFKVNFTFLSLILTLRLTLILTSNKSELNVSRKRIVLMADT
jgi:hypothetical protein